MSAVTGVIANFYENYTLSDEEHAKVYAPSAGAVSFVQLFASSLVLNPHLHMIFLDGVYGRGRDGLRFYPHPSFTTEAMFDVLYAIHDRLSAVFRRRGYVRELVRLVSRSIPRTFHCRFDRELLRPTAAKAGSLITQTISTLTMTRCPWRGGVTSATSGFLLMPAWPLRAKTEMG